MHLRVVNPPVTHDHGNLLPSAPMRVELISAAISAVLLTLGAFRALVLIEQGYTWAAWVTLGGIFVIAGAFLWTKRNP